MPKTARELVSHYTDRKMSGRPEFYLGRGNCLGDLNSALLEEIYKGVKQEHGAEAAKAFVKMVGDLNPDASASYFLQCLYRLEDRGWKYTPPQKHESIEKNTANILAEVASDALKSGDRSARDKVLGLTQIVMFAGAPMQSDPYDIIGDFLGNHRAELGPKPHAKRARTQNRDSFLG